MKLLKFFGDEALIKNNVSKVTKNKKKIHTEESKFLIKISKYGIPRSEETKEKIRIAMIGKKRGPLSIETRNKISESKKGKHHSEETKLKISISKKKQLDSNL